MFLHDDERKSLLAILVPSSLKMFVTVSTRTKFVKVAGFAPTYIYRATYVEVTINDVDDFVDSAFHLVTVPNLN
jgi:hypothetical protein